MAVYNTTCVVCGRFSTRASWNNTITIGSNTYVGCDFHSQQEINDAAVLANNASAAPEPSLTENDTSLEESTGS